MAEKVKSVQIVRNLGKSSSVTKDLLVVEEPLEIRIGYGAENTRKQYSLTITMRTPGDDEHLCLGFLYCEDIISGPDDILSAKYCSNVKEVDGGKNIMRVELKPEIDFLPTNFRRNFYTTSSCGVCGKASIEQVEISCIPIESTIKVEQKVILGLPDKLLELQDVFNYTGGVHACGLFNGDGNLLMHKEDVGRHNALDKLVGSLLLSKQLPAADNIVMLSGRISYELVQKSIKAGIGIIAAVGAPSSLAVELADKFGVTLIGFIKETGFNIYTNKERIIS